MNPAHKQQHPIIIIYQGRQLTIGAKDSGIEFGEKLVTQFLEDYQFMQILDGLSRVTGGAALYLKDELQKIGKGNGKPPSIDTYG